MDNQPEIVTPESQTTPSPQPTVSASPASPAPPAIESTQPAASTPSSPTGQSVVGMPGSNTLQTPVVVFGQSENYKTSGLGRLICQKYQAVV